MFQSTKKFSHLASAYRNHYSKTDCYLLHGYCRDISVIFACKTLDKQGFVVDFGMFKPFKQWLEDNFDHTTVLQADDPLVPRFRKLEAEGLMKLTLVPTVSCEGWAMFIAKKLDEYIAKETQNRAWVVSLQVHENSKNSALYVNVDSEGQLTDDMAFEDLLELVSDMEGTVSED